MYARVESGREEDRERQGGREGRGWEREERGRE